MNTLSVKQKQVIIIAICLVWMLIDDQSIVGAVMQCALTLLTLE